MKKYEIELIQASLNSAQQQLKSLQSEGWKIAGPIVPIPCHPVSGVEIMIPLKRKIRIKEDLDEYDIHRSIGNFIQLADEKASPGKRRVRMEDYKIVAKGATEVEITNFYHWLMAGCPRGGRNITIVNIDLMKEREKSYNQSPK